jgi:hypothetical protein
MPVGAEILKVGIDPNGVLCVWALVDPFETDTTPRTFEVIGTGWNFNPTGKTYLDTIFVSQLVWHIWEHDL